MLKCSSGPDELASRGTKLEPSLVNAKSKLRESSSTLFGSLMRNGSKSHQKTGCNKWQGG